jgi:16S rRNA C967 or C1407 C5-methylase (RsmB/RsmF family)
MVYSTCSFNPIENEAVVCELLRRCEGALELVDVSHKLPGLKRSGGMTKWVVHSGGKNGLFVDSLEQVPKDRSAAFLCREFSERVY